MTVLRPKFPKRRKDDICRCRRCNRRLTDDESMARGYGPTCFKKTARAIQKELEEAGQLRMDV